MTYLEKKRHAVFKEHCIAILPSPICRTCIQQEKHFQITTKWKCMVS